MDGKIKVSMKSARNTETLSASHRTSYCSTFTKNYKKKNLTPLRALKFPKVAREFRLSRPRNWHVHHIGTFILIFNPFCVLFSLNLI